MQYPNTAYDVVIVGAGPTGLSVAAELLRGKIAPDSILIIDLNEQPVIHTKASALWPRSLELLNQYPGVVESLSDYGVKVSNVAFRTDGDRLLNQFPIASKLNSTFSHGILCEQWFTEYAISKYLGQNGLTVTRSARLLSFAYDDDFDDEYPVETVIRVGSGDFVVRTKYLIGCDGAKSSVRKLAGIDFEGETLSGTFYSAHFSVEKSIPMLDETLSVWMRSDGLGFVTPMPNNTYMIGLDLKGEQCEPFVSKILLDLYGNHSLLDIPDDAGQRLIEERIYKGLKINKMIWKSHFRINERVASRYCDGMRDRDLFLKMLHEKTDSCHAHTPLGGQGQNTGIQDAINIGWKLAMVLKNNCTALILDTYEAERSVIGQHLVAFTSTSQKTSSSRSPMVQFIRNTALSLSASREFFVSLISQTIGETIYHYRNSALSIERWELIKRGSMKSKSKRIYSGDRVSCFMLPKEVGTMFFNATCGFKLVLFAGKKSYVRESDFTNDELRQFAEKVRDGTMNAVSDALVIDDSKDKVYQAFGAREQCLFLIRPDEIVGLVTL
ncbi:hypothetical protein HK100_001378 [Physocladia obscura]|uniref:FAD-binding domain-containing protein n=1 Tax=Physocladia obscura TaxID=109957 RepID=A0AAD5TFU5_9FUNG|nr:hypothetical protein HK100_001378 [Physocladia obscura]